MALAGRFGVHKKTITTHLQRLAVPRRYRLLDQSDARLAAELYGRGWSFARLGAKFGVAPNKVQLALRWVGEPMRPRPGR
jgi:hypothetical protein